MAREKVGLFFVKTLSGSPPAMMWVPLKGGTAYYEGQPLRISATTGSAARVAAGGTAVFGIAAANVTSNATTTMMPVWLCDDNNVFEGRIAAPTGNAWIRFADRVALTVGTVHNYRLTSTVYFGNATASFRIVGCHPDDITGTAANKRYWVMAINKASLVGDGLVNK